MSKQARLNAYWDNVLADIDEHGFHTVGVMNGPHSFAYTVGLEAALGHPELLITGIDPDTGHHFIHRLVDRIKTGQVINPEDIFNGTTAYQMALRKVDTVRACERHMCITGRLYEGADRFRALQIVYPDPKGLFPWQGGYDFPAQELLFDLDK